MTHLEVCPLWDMSHGPRQGLVTQKPVATGLQGGRIIKAVGFSLPLYMIRAFSSQIAPHIWLKSRPGQ